MKLPNKMNPSRSRGTPSGAKPAMGTGWRKSGIVGHRRLDLPRLDCPQLFTAGVALHAVKRTAFSMATVLKIPAAKRAKTASPMLTREALDMLMMIEHIGGVEAFDEAARRLLVAVAAAVSRLESEERLHYLLDLIVAPELVRVRRGEFKD